MTDLTKDELGNCYKLFYFLLITNKTGQPPRCREQLEDRTCFIFVIFENLERLYEDQSDVFLFRSF